jgi:uncharacterized membrane protein YkoI
MTIIRPLLPPVLLAALLLAPTGAGSQDDAPRPVTDPSADFERALGAVSRGEIMRLGEILPRVEKEFGGRAIETEIETEDGRWVYEFEILTDDGRLFEVDVDAVTGQTLEVEEEVD